MLALTLKDCTKKDEPLWASLVESGNKRIETRSWPIFAKYRDEPFMCLITASASSLSSNAGRAVCVVEFDGCAPMTEEHEIDACCKVYPGAWAWFIKKVYRLNEKFEVKGMQGLWNYNGPDFECHEMYLADYAAVEQRILDEIHDRKLVSTNITVDKLLARGFKPSTSVGIYQRGIIQLSPQRDGWNLYNGEEHRRSGDLVWPHYNDVDQLDALLSYVFPKSQQQ